MKSAKYFISSIFLVIFITFHTPAQQPDVSNTGSDSLSTETQLFNLNKECSKIISKKPQEGIVLAQKLLLLAQENNTPHYEALAIQRISDGYFFQNDYKQAITYLKKALKIREQLNDSIDIAATYNKLGVNYRYIAQYDTALLYLFHCLSINETIRHPKGISKALNNIGGIYRKLGTDSIALKYYLRALQINRSINDSTETRRILNNIGVIYRGEKKYVKALEYYNASLDIAIAQKQSDAMAQTFNNLGILYNEINRPKEALSYFNQALTINRQHNNKRSISISLRNIAHIYFTQRRYLEAEAYLKEALTTVEKLGLSRRKLQIYEAFVDLYAAQNNFSAAFNYQKMSHGLSDSINSIEIADRISKIKSDYELESKQHELNKIKSDKILLALKYQKGKVISYGLSLLIILFILLSVLLYRQNQLILKGKNIELEQKLLRSQMNPHFIFNSLAAIQSYIYKNDPASAGRFLSTFAKLIRGVLMSSREESISLERELNSLESYLTLQQLRFDNKFSYHITVDKTLDPENITIPPMLAQPFIENALEHGIKYQTEKGHVDIHIEQQNQFLSFEVIDNGIGINKAKQCKAEKNTHHVSYAMAITRERLQSLNKHYKQKIILKVTDRSDENPEEHGTRVKFSIPYSELF